MNYLELKRDTKLSEFNWHNQPLEKSKNIYNNNATMK